MYHTSPREPLSQSIGNNFPKGFFDSIITKDPSEIRREQADALSNAVIQGNFNTAEDLLQQSIAHSKGVLDPITRQVLYHAASWNVYDVSPNEALLNELMEGYSTSIEELSQYGPLDGSLIQQEAKRGIADLLLLQEVNGQYVSKKHSLFLFPVKVSDNGDTTEFLLEKIAPHEEPTRSGQLIVTRFSGDKLPKYQCTLDNGFMFSSNSFSIDTLVSFFGSPRTS